METDNVNYDFERDDNSKNSKRNTFDPIKLPKDGKQAERVIWSTDVLNAAVDGINKGLPLKANPFIGKDTQLLKPDLVYKRTEEEINDYIKCMNDPIHFASKCFIKTPTGMQQCKLRDYQVDYINHLKDNRFSILLSCRQAGKCFLCTEKCDFSFPKSLIFSEFNTIKIHPLIKLLKSFDSYIEDNNVIIKDVPLYELQNLFNESCIWKLKYHIYKATSYLENKISKTISFVLPLLYFIISLIDWFNFIYIKKKKLLDGYKTIEEIDISEYGIKVLTDTGFEPISYIYNTKPFEIYDVTLKNGYNIKCADKHKFFDWNFNTIYADELVPNKSYIQTDVGLQLVSSIYKRNKLNQVSMCDITVEHPNHRFYTNGILSHNSVTTAIFCLWSVIFRTDRNALLLSKSGPAGVDLLSKIKDMYRYLPYYLKPGILKWNQKEISFDNNSSMSTEPFSPTAGLGKTINFLILDEFAWCPPNDVELFYNNIIPTVTTDTTANVCIISTQNGFNLFYKLFTAAQQGKNIYKPMTVHWWDVPNWDNVNKKWVKRDDKWHQDMIGVLGSVESFEYQYGTMFLTSDNCIVPRETLSRLMQGAEKFVCTEENPLYASNYNKFLYIKNNYNISKDKYYIVTVDLAEGAGKDYTVFSIFEILSSDKLEHVAYWRSNSVDIENASLEFWLMVGQLFNPNKFLVSIEWNTYGALFYTYILNLNDYDTGAGSETSNMRFELCPNGIDTSCILEYPKQSQEDAIAGIGRNASTIPGVKMTHSNKTVACALLKNMLIKDTLKVTDLQTVNEIQNFEDRSGNGSFAASYGHDDIVMTLVQLTLAINNGRYNYFIEEMQENSYESNIYNNIYNNNTYYNTYDNGGGIDISGLLTNRLR